MSDNLRDDSDLPEQHAAVVVFTSLRAVDEDDAGFIVRRALRQIFRRESVVPGEAVLLARFPQGDVAVRVHDEVDLRHAAQGGWVTMAPGVRAYRENPGEAPASSLDRNIERPGVPRGDDVDGLGRLASHVAGQLRLLCERMADLSWQPDGHNPTDLAQIANALQGMALRCAMSTGNAALLSELIDRQVRELDADLPQRPNQEPA